MNDRALIPIIRQEMRAVSVTGAAVVPAVIEDAGPNAKRRFVEFFTANIRNPNTREAYLRAARYFCSWCSERCISLERIEPVHVSVYIEGLTRDRNPRTGKQYEPGSVKLHLAA